MGWSNMLPEVLDVIARKHIVFYEDYHSFAGVCKSWHTVALKAAKEVAKGNGAPSRLPSLMLSEETKDKKCREIYLLSNKTIREIRLPQVYGKLCMSSCGWLLTVANDHSSQLINPLSREIFELPKVDTFPRSDIKIWYDSIKKLLFIAELSLVVVVWGYQEKLGYCRIGDNKWTPVDNAGSTIMDITYYNRQVYIFDFHFAVKVWDVHGEDPTKIVVLHSHVPADFYADDAEDLRIAYILGLDDGERKRLLVVSRKGVIDQDEDDYETNFLRVWDFDLEDREWSKVSDLGNKTLFVGHSSSFWIEDTTGVIKGNCIYFTDDVVEAYRESQYGGGEDMGTYDLSDESIARHFTGESHSHLTPPIWLQSM
ncbi:hypothetical protein CTI12_AA279960 [Artemisia annua]|uniref:KIB1-4 beta-propeller domain-containing protein n=1 Tax=Artemisia annua TaxID=35608 RepID=A0A2U1NB84_ARTAN|nr:hypothetical protein CTI12_AA279960 [Artemisia annua]